MFRLLTEMHGDGRIHGYFQTKLMTFYLGRKCPNLVLSQENIQFLCLCLGGQWHNENSKGNLVCKFPYFRKYSEITNISWPKVVFLFLSLYFQITDSTFSVMNSYQETHPQYPERTVLYEAHPSTHLQRLFDVVVCGISIQQFVRYRGRPLDSGYLGKVAQESFQHGDWFVLWWRHNVIFRYASKSRDSSSRQRPLSCSQFPLVHGRCHLSGDH